MAELKLHLKCYSGMVQISVQAVTLKPHTDTFFMLDLGYKKRVSKKNYGKLRKQYNHNFYLFSFLHDQLNPSMPKKSTGPFKI